MNDRLKFLDGLRGIAAFIPHAVHLTTFKPRESCQMDRAWYN